MRPDPLRTTVFSSDLALRRAHRWFLALFAGCVLILAAVLYLQHQLNLDPCPWCVAQRIVMVVLAIVALGAALHRPRRNGARTYWGVLAVLAACGVAAAGYHIYLQSDSERAMKCAGSMIERLLDQSRLGNLAPWLFQYDGPCTLKPWSFLGLSIPELAAVAFVLIFAIAVRGLRSLNKRDFL